jgi:hypothetical protein
MPSLFHDSRGTLKNRGKEEVMQINFDKKSGLLLGIIAGLLVIVIVLLVDKVEDDEHMIESNSHQIIQNR